MKAKYIILLLLFIPIVFAQTAELNRNEFGVGETIIVYIDSKYPLTSELTNVNFHILNEYGRELSSTFFVTKLTDSKYVAYMTIPSSFMGNNYTLRISNVYYVKDRIFEHFVQNLPFSMKDRVEYSLSVDPGGVYLDLSKQDYFYLNLKNTGSNVVKVSLKYGIDIFDVPQNEFDIYPGDFKKLKIGVKEQGENILSVTYDEGRLNYDINVLGGSKLPVDVETPVESQGSMMFTNVVGDKLIKTVVESESQKGIIRIRNNGQVKLTNVRVYNQGLQDVVTLNPDVIPVIDIGAEKDILVTVNEDKNMNANYDGKIIIEAIEGSKLELPVSLYYKALPSVEENTSQDNIFEEETETEVIVDDAEKEIKLGAILSLVAIIFVIVITLIILFKLRKSESKRKRKY